MNEWQRSSCFRTLPFASSDFFPKLFRSKSRRLDFFHKLATHFGQSDPKTMFELWLQAWTNEAQALRRAREKFGSL